MPEKIGRLIRHSQGGGVKMVRPGHFTSDPRVHGPAESVPVFYENWLIVEVDEGSQTPSVKTVGSKHRWSSFRVELTTNGRPASKPSD